MSKQFVKFKVPKQGTTLMYMHPLIIVVMFDMANWFNTRGIDFVVTDTISNVKRDKKLGRVSSSHRDKRAFDCRSRNLSEAEQGTFLRYFNSKYEDIASISRSDLKSRLVVLHGEGDNEHFHVALHSKFKINY